MSTAANSRRSLRLLPKRTTVLILTAFCAGIIARFAEPLFFDWSVYAVVASGCLFCLAWTKFAEFKERRDAELAKKQAEWLLLNRMNRHVPKHTAPKPKFTSMPDWQQYVSVPGRD